MKEKKKKRPQRWLVYGANPRTYSTKKELLADIKGQIVMFGPIRKY